MVEVMVLLETNLSLMGVIEDSSLMMVEEVHESSGLVIMVEIDHNARFMAGLAMYLINAIIDLI